MILPFDNYVADGKIDDLFQLKSEMTGTERQKGSFIESNVVNWNFWF